MDTQRLAAVAVLMMVVAACGSDSDASDPAASGGAGGGGQGLTVCSCSRKDSVGYCQQMNTKPGSAAGIAGDCAYMDSTCAPNGGVYATAACPTEDLVGTCLDDESTPDDADKAYMLTNYMYSTGSQPFTVEIAEGTCEEDEVFSTSPQP